MLFKEIVGQEDIKKRLIQTVRDNRISHAQLLLGPAGSGNLALAFAYAQYIFCSNKGEHDSCGECSSCLKMQKIAHPDFHFVFPVYKVKDGRETISDDLIADMREALTQNPYLELDEFLDNHGIENKQAQIYVGESASILRKLSFKAYEGEYRIVIIWKPEKMNVQAANKILKMIEEPPERTLFIMVAENTDLMLATILSRTQMVKIKKIDDASMQKALVEKFNLAPENALRITHLADGNFSAAMKMAAEGDDSTDNTQRFRDWMLACYKNNIPEMLNWSEKLASTDEGREKQKAFLAFCQNMFRKALMQTYSTPELARMTENERSFFLKFSTFVNGNNIMEIAAELDTASYHIERNAYPKLLFFDLSLKLGNLLRMSQQVVVKP
ncbi:MAG: ATP-binding protein [Bacteroidia bacterium]